MKKSTRRRKKCRCCKLWFRAQPHNHQRQRFCAANRAVDISVGSLSPTINWTTLKLEVFDLPPLDQQRRIAEILWAVDEVQVSNTRLQEDSWALLNSTLDEHIAPKPEQARNLAEFFSVKHGWAFEGEFFNDSGNGPILLTPGNFALKGELYFNEKNTKYYSGDFPHDYVLSPGDIVTVMTDLTPDAKLLGMPSIVGNENRLLHNQRIGKMEFKGEALEPRFAYYLLLSDAVRRQIRKTASGSTVRHTSPTRILEAKANIPTRREQLPLVRQFDAALSTHHASVEAGRNIIHLATSLREAMLNPK